jgi:MFS family permease
MLQSSRPRFYRGWAVVAVLFLGGFAMYGAGLYSFILFVTPLADEFHWSRAATGALVSAFWLSAPLALFAEPLIRRLGTRTLVVSGIVLEACCLVLLITATQLWLMYLLRVLAGLGKVLYAITMPVIVARWFSRRFGLAIAVMYSGWHIGGLVLAPITAHLIHSIGWRGASVVLGIAVLGLALLPMIWALRVSSPQELGLGLDGEPLPGEPAPGEAPQAEHLAPRLPYWSAVRDLLGNRSFQLIIVASIAYFTTYGGVLGHQAAVVQGAGISARTASFVLGATAGFAALGAVLVGALIDRAPLIYTTLVQYGLMATGVLCLLLVGKTDSVPVLTTHAVCFGLAVGGTEVFWITVLRRRLPEAAFPRAWGIWYFLELAVLVAAPAAAGLLYDLTGNYVTALRSELALLFVPLVLSMRLAVQKSRC